MYSIIKAILDRHGYTLVAYERADSQALIIQIRDLFRALSPDFVIDVGAYVGGYGKMFRRDVGFAGRILSFEPLPEHYKLLTGLIADDPLWEARQVGVGSETGTLGSNVQGELSSLLTLNLYVVRGLRTSFGLI
jgi:hypothetical protein